MKEKRECKLVQDLLPNYIEQVTSEETNQYIQEHLQNCTECKQVYSSMTEEIKSKALDTDKTVDYMKKVNQKMKIAKIALESVIAVILCAMLIFWANTLRNYRILEELRQTLKETQKISNYHSRMSVKSMDEGIMVVNIYEKNEKIVAISQMMSIYGDNYKNTSYFKDNQRISYNEGNIDYSIDGINYRGQKTVKVDENYPIETFGLSNWFLEDLEISKLRLSMRVKIGKTTYQGKECYVVENDRFTRDPNQHVIYYIEKDTGLTVRQIQNEQNTDYNYEFGNVKDEIFEEPNREEYKLIE